MADASTWTRAHPSGSSQLRDFDDLYRSDKSIFEASFLEEHYWKDGSAASAGRHKLGSARWFSGASSAVSATGEDGRAMWDTTNLQLVALHASTSTRIPSLASNNTWAGTQTFSAAVTCSSTLAVTGKAAVGGTALSTYNLEIASHARILAAGEVSLQLHDTTTARFELVSNSSGFQIRDANAGAPVKLTIAPTTGAVTVAGPITASADVKLAPNSGIYSTAATEFVRISGGDAEGSGGDIVLYGPSHPTLPSRMEIAGQVSLSGGLGFYGAAPIPARPTITGSRGGNAALASLLTTLASLGLITDSSSA